MKITVMLDGEPEEAAALAKALAGRPDYTGFGQAVVDHLKEFKNIPSGMTRTEWAARKGESRE